MFEVDSLFVVATSRGQYVAHDMIRAILWSCQRPAYVILIDRTGDVGPIPDGFANYTILTTDPSPAADGWVAGLGLRWAVDKGVRTKQFVLLDDRCLVTQPGIDSWALEHMQKTQVGLLGAGDRLNYEDAYGKCTPWFDAWDLPHTMFEPGSQTLHESALWLSVPLVTKLYEQNALPPEHCQQWPLPYGPFISWTAQMLGFFQVAWGNMDRQLPPLYINHTGRSRQLPAPPMLSQHFALFFSARHCPSYSEEELREIYKRVRGEPAKVVQSLRPAVSPQPLGPAETG